VPLKSFRHDEQGRLTRVVNSSGPQVIDLWFLPYEVRTKGFEPLTF
jgi:hypothetical protein